MSYDDESGNTPTPISSGQFAQLMTMITAEDENTDTLTKVVLKAVLCVAEQFLQTNKALLLPQVCALTHLQCKVYRLNAARMRDSIRL